jgi:cytoskeletal protein RodZ
MRDRDPGMERSRRDHDVLPQAVSDRVLARASELDAALRSGASVVQLRAAALEAGISGEAFDAALAEVQRDGDPARPARRRSWRRRRVLLFLSAFLLAMGLAIAFRTVVPRPIEAPPTAPAPAAPAPPAPTTP